MTDAAIGLADVLLTLVAMLVVMVALGALAEFVARWFRDYPRPQERAHRKVG